MTIQTTLKAGIAALALGLGTASIALSGASAADMSRLGADLTPVGAEKAGNADGSIPAWTGGIDVSTSTGSQLKNPFSGDQVILKIDQSNVDQHAGRLSAGQVAMIKRYPDYFIPVYQTRRTFANPQQAYDHVKAEAGRIELVGGGQGITGLDKSPVAFPFPETGVEVLWNHITRYRDAGFARTYMQAPVQSNGAYTLQRLRDTTIFRPRLSGGSDNENMLLKFMQEILAPARLEGNVLLVHDYIDQVKDPRAAWVYNAGQRRVRRAPNIAYDGPGTAAEGMRTTDDFDMFNGSPDKYDWKLVGKREMYLPANNFALADPGLSYEELLGEKHINQEHTRYELRRAWVIEGTLKSDERHIYGKRTYYVDEDSWFISLGDLYDSRGELWRVREAFSGIESNAKVLLPLGEPVYDLQAGRYLALSFLSEENPQFTFDVDLDDGDFTPSALRRRGRK
ncbi:MAG: DUF1329 domain-containing protein [Pseudomonadota bacterium]